MSQLSSEKFLMTADKTIPGRCRLVGVTISSNDDGGRVNATRTAIDYRLLSFRNGTSTGSELFKFSIPVGTDAGYGIGVRPFSFMLGENRILFEDGIFLAAADVSGTTTYKLKKETQVIVYYEAG